MIAQFKQDLYNKNFTFQDQSKEDEIDTLEDRIKFWLKINNNAHGPVPDNLCGYDFNEEGLGNSVSGSKIIPETAEFIKLLDILRCK